MACVIEIQGYTCSQEKLIPKEIVICSASKTRKFVVKPHKNIWEFSKNDITRISWATNRYHYIDWRSGDTNLDEIPYLLYIEALPFSEIYTKGREKALYLTDLLGRKVHDLSDFNCPSVRKENLVPCDIHKSSKAHCAAANARYLLQWIAKHLPMP
jgi:hypothetical protein